VTFECHLILQELILAPSAEWSPHSQGWLMVRVADGMGYWLEHNTPARQLTVGDGLTAVHNGTGVLRASQLGPVKLQFFTVRPQYLNGLLTVSEWHQLEVAPNQSSPRVSLFTAAEPVGQKFTRLAEQSPSDGLPVRCALLQLWAGTIAGLLPTPLKGESVSNHKLSDRFRQLVGRMPEAELSGHTLNDLAGQLHCSERHFSRLFREEFGVPLRARQIELRLQRARQFLASSDAKIINIAYDCGYRHLGLFNAMFKKRFGVTPSEWRQQNNRKSFSIRPRNRLLKATTTRAAVLLVLCLLGFFLPGRAQINSTAVPAQASSPVMAESNPVPRFNVLAYAVNGSPMLATNVLTQIFSKHTGPDISLDEIVAAASELQSEYRNQGHPGMSVAIARQQITNGIVTMSVFQAAVPQILVSGKRYAGSAGLTQADTNSPAVEPALPQPAPATLATTTNAVLPAASHPAVAATPEEIARARAAMYAAMAEQDAREKDTRIHVASTNSGSRFEVNKYLITGNSVLAPEAIALALTNIDGDFGTNTSFDGIRTAMTELQALYRERGFVTVSVGLPRQKLTNGTVKVQVTEGRLAAIDVTGNRYFSSNNVMRALPSLHTNLLLNSLILQRELDNANASRDRQIYPVIGPGPDPGTSELTLKVKDCLPFHSRLELNNQSTPGTPDLRVNLNAQYDNLWDLDQQAGLQYSFSPGSFKGENDYIVSPFDDPLVANYSGYYRIPLGGYDSVAQEVESRPGSFGYNEVTHRFDLPAATGRPELNIYASRSTSDTGVQYSPATLVTSPTNQLLKIVSQDTGDNVTLNEGWGARLSLPLPQVFNLSSTFSAGLDFKRYQTVSYNTNNFISSFTYTNGTLGKTTVVTRVASPQPTRDTTLLYLPFNVGWNGSIPDSMGTTMFNFQANFNVAGLLSDSADFGKVAYTTNAHAGYITLQMGADRTQTIYEDWTVKLHADGQWANGPLISNEQFAMGGTAGVRGYQDGESYGDTGWRCSIEPQTPLFNAGMIGNERNAGPCWLRGSVFLDYGQVYRLDPSLNGLSYCGTGFGVTANVGSHLDGRLTVAWPLISQDLARAGSVHIYFGVGAQF